MTRTTKAIVKTLRTLGLNLPEHSDYKLHRVARQGYDEAWSWYLSDDSGRTLAASQWAATTCLQALKENRLSLDIPDPDDTSHLHDLTPTLNVRRADPYNCTHYGEDHWGPPCMTADRHDPRTKLSTNYTDISCPKCRAYYRKRNSPAQQAARQAEDEMNQRVLEHWRRHMGW